MFNREEHTLLSEGALTIILSICCFVVEFVIKCDDKFSAWRKSFYLEASLGKLKSRAYNHSVLFHSTVENNRL